MSRDENILSMSFDYYDKQLQKYKKFYQKGALFDISNNKLDDITFPVFTLKRGEDVLSGTYNIAGVYFPNLQEWVWGWAINWTDQENSTAKSKSLVSRRILEYGLDMTYKFSETDQQDIVLSSQLRMELISSRIKIEHPIQLEKILAVAQYITHTELIYRVDTDLNNAITYYLLSPSNIP